MSKGLTYDQLFPGRFVKAGEFGGKPVTLTIKDVYLDDLESESGATERKAIVSFERTARELVLNKTNAQCLVAMWGPDSGEWVGKRVTLTPESDPSGLSDSGLCIRVKGSPDIDKTVTATIKLPRRRPITRKLVPTKGPADPGEDAFGGGEDGACVAVCDECGQVVELTPDVTADDVADMVCGACGGSMRMGGGAA